MGFDQNNKLALRGKILNILHTHTHTLFCSSTV